MARPITRELPANPAADRRATTRVLVDLEVDCEGEGVYLFAISRDLSATGIFVRTLEPMPPGTRVNLRLSGPALDDSAIGSPARQLTVEGEVAWVNPYRPGALGNLDPGIGVRFVDVDDRTRVELMRLVRRIAYIDD
ncbi:MAG TPA: PilZ domain-containing protein [Kofleriaceae bacterium]|nr:PilZ domain-containing protein [Kofleriaceae bacterium]